MLNAPANPPGVKFKTLDLGDEIRLWIINCASSPASMYATHLILRCLPANGNIINTIRFG